MNREKLLTAFTAIFLSGILAMGTAGCLVTAFDLPLAYPGLVILAGWTAAVVSAAAFSFRRGGIALMLALLSGGLLLWRDSTAWDQTLQLIQMLSIQYDRAYDWGVLVLTELPEEWFADYPVAIVGIFAAMAAAGCICQSKSPWLSAAAALLPLSSCIVVTNTVPSEGFLMMVMGSLILLILTSSVRRENAAQGLRLTYSAVLPVILGLIVLFLAVPQKGYVNQSKELQQSIIHTIQQLPQRLEYRANLLMANFRPAAPETVDLALLGSRDDSGFPVMEVTADTGGMVYLRRQDYDSYDGLGWTASADRQEEFFQAGEPLGTVTVTTRESWSELFLPYYPESAVSLTGGFAANESRDTTYAIARRSLPGSWRQTAYAAPAPRSYPGTMGPYLSLPEDTRQRAREMLADVISRKASNTEKADLICAYVMNSARYSLTVDTMPADRPDFALWFLTEQEAGYCVHFATAATVLLRAADIPARFVSGYMAEAIPGQTVTVTQNQAHAWTEYYEPSLDAWILLDATPAEEIRQDSVTVIATQPQTLPTTQPTQPPEETTVPATQPTETVPETQPEPTAPEPPEPKPPVISWQWLLIPVLAVSILETQSLLRRKLRQGTRHRGSTNAIALRLWQEGALLCRLLKQEPEDSVTALAQKAKFSQHTITPEELALLTRHNNRCLAQLKRRPWYYRWYCRWVYAVK